MNKNFKRFLSLAVVLVMVFAMFPMNVYAEETGATITGTITEDAVWNDGDVVGGVTIADDVTITVNGTVEVAGTISMGADALCNVVFNGENNATLIRSADFTGQMFYVGGNSYVFQNLTFNDITLDGGAVWTGDVDATLNRGTVNEGVKATGSVLYLVCANAVLNNCTLQNHDDSVGSKSVAVFLREYATVDFENCVLRNNTCIDSYYKGGVVTTRYGGSVTANSTEVYGNSAVYGGFVGVSASGAYGCKVQCTNTKIHHNYASIGGAAFYLQDDNRRAFQTLGDRRFGYVKLNGCTLEHNGSPDGLIYSYTYYMPTWVEDTVIENNDCAVYVYAHGNENRSFSVAGSTRISGTSTSLYETPVRIFGQLDSDASIPMNEEDTTRLMDSHGYLVNATPDYPWHYNHTGKNQSSVVPYEYTSRALYDITLDDLEQIELYEGNGYSNWVLTDVDGNGMVDAVPVADETLTTVNVSLLDTFKGGSELETQDVSNIVKNVPICFYEHTGYFFNGWLMEDGTLIKNQTSNAILNGGETLTAAWAVARPRITIHASEMSTKLGNSITLTAEITNRNADYLNYTYQWYRNEVAIEGATDRTYTVTEEEAGYYSYQFKAIATDPSYDSDSDYATMTSYGTANYMEGTVLLFTAPPAAQHVVTVTFENAAIAYGDDAPAPVYTIDYGTGSAEAVSINVDPTLITDPSVGEHEITGVVTLTDGTGDADEYAVKLVPGKLTVFDSEVNDYVAYNVQDDLFFDDLSDALDVADAGEKVQLLKTWYEELVLVPAGVTFDLNGNVVETENTLSFGVIMDGQQEVGGIQIDIDTTKAFTKLQPVNGGYLPIYDTNTGMYKFFAFKVQSNAVTAPTSNSVKFYTRVVFDNVEGYKVLANTDDSGIDFVLNMNWTGMEGFEILYYMTDANLKQYAQKAYDQLSDENVNTKAMTATVHGVNVLGSGADISAAPSVETIAEVTASADVQTYDIP